MKYLGNVYSVVDVSDICTQQKHTARGFLTQTTRHRVTQYYVS